MVKHRTKTVAPRIPNYILYIYVTLVFGSIIFTYTEHSFMHGVCSVLPHFMCLYVMKNRLIRNDLGSALITVSFLAESFGMFNFILTLAHFFH